MIYTAIVAPHRSAPPALRRSTPVAPPSVSPPLLHRIVISLPPQLPESHRPPPFSSLPFSEPITTLKETRSPNCISPASFILSPLQTRPCNSSLTFKLDVQAPSSPLHRHLSSSPLAIVATLPPLPSYPQIPSTILIPDPNPHPSTPLTSLPGVNPILKLVLRPLLPSLSCRLILHSSLLRDSSLRSHPISASNLQSQPDLKPASSSLPSIFKTVQPLTSWLYPRHPLSSSTPSMPSPPPIIICAINAHLSVAPPSHRSLSCHR